jgi:GT2 family glycosyltransferase
MNATEKCRIGIILPCKNEGIYIKQTLDFLNRTEARNISNLIIIDDNSNDNCCDFFKYASKNYPNAVLLHTNGIGAAGARNIGADFASWAEILVFCDAHIIMQPNWLNTLLKTFDNKDVSVVCPGISDFPPYSPAGYGQSWNENFETYWLKKPRDISEIPLAPGGCMAVRKNVFDAVEGFDRGFNSWGFEDVELSLKLWLFDYKVFVHPGVKISHKFRKKQPYDVDLTQFLYNKLRMAYSHFNENRVCRVIKLLQECSHYNKALSLLASSDTYVQRNAYFNRRIHDDDWFFNKFKIPF